MTPSPADFYVTGGTMPRDASSYVPRAADDLLFDGLRRGEFCYVLTARQMGKSSLMVRTAQRLRAAGVTVVTLDLTRVGKNLTAEQWYDGLLARVGQQLQLGDEFDAYWQRNDRLGPLQRFMGVVRDVVLARRPGPVVVFVDEIDYVRGLKFPTDEFFAAVRQCYNARAEDPEYRRLTFAMLGVAAPSDLIGDPRTTPFNVGRRVELHDFTPAEAAVLARGLNRDDRVAARLLRRVLWWTGGNPYLTQRLCRAVAEDPGVTGPAGVDRVCRDLFLAPGAQERDDNLMFVRDRLLRAGGEGEEDRAALLAAAGSPAARPAEADKVRGEDRVALLDLYEQVRRGRRVADDETNPLVGLLRLSGAVRSEDGHLRVRNRIYARVFDGAWVAAHMPGAEKRRQRRAFRRGVLRASSIAAAVMVALAALGWVAWQKTREVDLANAKAQSAQDHAAEQERARKDAEAARRDAEEQREKARTEAARARELTIELSAFRGNELLDERDVPAALVWFRDALERAREGPARDPDSDRAREAPHRLRLAAAMEQCARPVWAWNAGGPVVHAEVSPDGRRVLAVRADGPPGADDDLSAAGPGPGPAAAKGTNEAIVWDQATGRPVARIPHPGGKYALTPHFGPDGGWLFYTNAEPNGPLTEFVRDLSTGQTRPGPWQVGPEGYCAFSPDGRRAAVRDGSGAVRLWDVANGAPVGEPVHLPERQVSMSFDGGRLVLATDRGGIRVVDATTGQAIGPGWDGPVNPTSVRLSRDGRLAAVVAESGRCEVRDVAEGRLVTPVRVVGLVRWTRFARGDRWLLTCETDTVRDSIRVYEIATGSLTEVIPLGKGRSSAESRDGRWLAVYGDDQTPRVIDLDPPVGAAAPPRPEVPGERPDGPAADTLPVLELDRHPAGVRSAAFSPDGRYLATACSDRKVRVWDFRRKALSTLPLVHPGPVTHTSFGPDGRHLLTAAADGTVRVWDLAAGYRPISAGEPARPAVAAGCSDDGRRVLVVHDDGTAGVCEIGTGRTFRFPAAGEWVVRGWLGPGGRRAVLVRAAGPAVVWDVDTARRMELEGTTGESGPFEFDPGGRWLAVATGRPGHPNREVRVWDAEREVLTRVVPPGPVDAVAVGPTGGVAVARRPGVVQFWGAAGEREPREWKVQPGWVVTLAFSRDGRRLAAGSVDGTVRVWSVPGGEPVATLRHGGAVTSVGLSRDGRFALTGGKDGTVRLWDLERKEREEPTQVFKLRPPVRQAVFDPTELHVVACAGETVRAWDRTTGKAVTPALDNESPVTAAQLDPDGRLVVICGDRGNCRAQVWDLTRRVAPADELLRLAAYRSGCKFASLSDRQVVPATAEEVLALAGPGGDAPGPDDDRRYSWREVQRCEAAGDWDGALWHLNRLMGDRPSSALLVRRGNVYVRLDQPDNALADYKRAAAADPRNPTVPWAVARAHLARGEAGFRAWPAPWASAPFAPAPAPTALGPVVSPALWAAGVTRADGPLPPWFRDCEQHLDKLPPSHPLTAQLTADLVAAYGRVGWQLVDASRPAWAREAFGKCREMADRARGGPGPVPVEVQLAAADWSSRGKDLEKRDRETAVAVYRAALALWDLAGELPADDSARSALFQLLMRLGETTPAADREARLRYYRRARDIAAARVRASMDDPDNARQNFGAVLDRLAELAREAGEVGDQEGYYRLAFESDREWLGRNPGSRRAREMAGYSYTALGKLARWRNDPAAARAYYEGAMKLRESLVAEYPEVDEYAAQLAETCIHLGNLCRDVRDLPGAKRYYQRQLDLAKELEDKLLGRGRANLTRAYENLGRAYYNLGEYADAGRYWREALDRRRADRKKDPDDRDARVGEAEALEWLGDIELELGHLRAAYDYCRQCRDLKQAIADENPTDLAAKRSLGYALVWLNETAFAAGEVEEAHDAAGDLLVLLAELEPRSAEEPWLRPLLASGRNKRGEHWLRLGDAQRAAANYRRLLGLRRETARTPPANDSDPAADLFWAHIALGRVELARDNVPAAIGWFEGAVLIMADRAGQAGDLVPPQLNLASGYAYLGRAELQAGRYAEAVGWFEKAAAVYGKLEAAGRLVLPTERKAKMDLDRELAAARGAPQAVQDIDFAVKQPTREASADLLILRAVTLVRKGDRQGALTAAEALRALGPEDPNNLFDVARCYALILRADARGQPVNQLPEAERVRRAECASRAVEALTAAVGHGFTDGARLLNDRALDAIRAEPGYRDLVPRFEGRPDPK